MNKKILLLTFLAVLFLPLITRAADVRNDNELMITEKIKNAYLFGNKINVQNDIESDLVAFGSELNLSKEVQKDVLSAAGTVKIEGKIGSNERILAGQIDQTGQIGEDLVAFYGTGNFTKTEVSGDVMLFGGETRLDANVVGKTKIFSSKTVLSGTYTSDVTIRSNSLTVEDGTNIKGKLVFSGPDQAKISEKAVIEKGVEYTKTKTKAVGFNKLTTSEGLLSLLQSILSLVTATLIIASLLKKYTVKIIENAEQSKFFNGLNGILTLIVAPFLILVAIVSVIGSMLGGVIALGYLTAVILAYVLSAIFIGQLFLRLINRESSDGLYLSCIVGSLLTIIISLIPYVGPWIIFVFFIIVLGSISRDLIETIRESTQNKDEHKTK